MGWFTDQAWLDNSIGVVLAVVVAIVVHLVIRGSIVRIVEREIRESPIRWDDVLLDRNVPRRAALMLPVVVVFVLVGVVPEADPGLVDAVRRVCLALMALVGVLVVSPSSTPPTTSTRPTTRRRGSVRSRGTCRS
jgi:hypothetical protein